jgi:hypothetical protein
MDWIHHIIVKFVKQLENPDESVRFLILQTLGKLKRGKLTLQEKYKTTIEDVLKTDTSNNKLAARSLLMTLNHIDVMDDEQRKEDLRNMQNEQIQEHRDVIIKQAVLPEGVVARELLRVNNNIVFNHDNMKHKWGPITEFKDNGYKYNGTMTTMGGQTAQMHGVGTLVHKDFTYTGHFCGDKIEGYGKMTSAEGKYEGEFKDGKKEGHGTFESSDGSVYIGEWKNDKRHGSGKQTSNDEVYDGEWKEDERHGSGNLTQSYLIHYDGEWSENFPHKDCIVSSNSGKVLLQGYWNNENITVQKPGVIQRRKEMLFKISRDKQFEIRSLQPHSM